MPDAVLAEGLVKTFGDTRALDGLDLAVPEGSVLGLLGPNGAGKTTAVRVFSTLLRPDGGRALVQGVDVVQHPQRVRRAIGLTGQFAAIDDYLTGRENLILFGRLYHVGGAAAAQRADELLERFDLVDAAGRIAKTYSGGMRRRLDIAASLISRPQVLFLDEPTTGLDPRDGERPAVAAVDRRRAGRVHAAVRDALPPPVRLSGDPTFSPGATGTLSC